MTIKFKFWFGVIQMRDRFTLLTLLFALAPEFYKLLSGTQERFVFNLPFFIHNFTLFEVFIFIQSFGEKFPIVLVLNLTLCVIVKMLFIDSKHAVSVFSLWECLGLVTWPQKLIEEGGTQLEAVGEESGLLTDSTPGWARRACALSVLPCLVTRHAVHLLR